MAALRLLTALASGLLFGLGLAMSGMLDPTRVRGFLDVAGHWDPSLAFVLGGAVLVASLGSLIRRVRRKPLFDERFRLPERSEIDGELLTGAAIFGIGWGMAGLCPGPAIADLTLGAPLAFLFVGTMIAGMLMHDRLLARPC